MTEIPNILEAMPRHFPGVAASVAMALSCIVLADTIIGIPGISGLLLAILAGVLWRNLFPVPETLEPGLLIAAKPILRWGIVLLGLQLSLGDIASLGWGVVALIFSAVVLTFALTLLLGRLLGVPLDLSLLVGSGFSICGAAAVAGTESVLKPKPEYTATALGLVVLFGTLMIPTFPVLTALFGMSDYQGALWAGASVHEVAQVVATAQALDPEVTGTAVTVKLGRVLMLAVILATTAWFVRHRSATEPPADVVNTGDSTKKVPHAKPTLIPWFVIGFMVCVVIATTGTVPEPALISLAHVQALLLATAMFALGMGVKLKSLISVGVRPVFLGAGSTAVILALGGVGASLLG